MIGLVVDCDTFNNNTRKHAEGRCSLSRIVEKILSKTKYAISIRHVVVFQRRISIPSRKILSIILSIANEKWHLFSMLTYKYINRYNNHKSHRIQWKKYFSCTQADVYIEDSCKNNLHTQTELIVITREIYSEKK